MITIITLMINSENISPLFVRFKIIFFAGNGIGKSLLSKVAEVRQSCVLFGHYLSTNYNNNYIQL